MAADHPPENAENLAELAKIKKTKLPLARRTHIIKEMLKQRADIRELITAQEGILTAAQLDEHAINIAAMTDTQSRLESLRAHYDNLKDPIIQTLNDLQEKISKLELSINTPKGLTSEHNKADLEIIKLAFEIQKGYLQNGRPAAVRNNPPLNTLAELKASVTTARNNFLSYAIAQGIVASIDKDDFDPNRLKELKGDYIPNIAIAANNNAQPPEQPAPAHLTVDGLINQLNQLKLNQPVQVQQEQHEQQEQQEQQNPRNYAQLKAQIKQQLQEKIARENTSTVKLQTAYWLAEIQLDHREKQIAAIDNDLEEWTKTIEEQGHQSTTQLTRWLLHGSSAIIFLVTFLTGIFLPVPVVGAAVALMGIAVSAILSMLTANYVDKFTFLKGIVPWLTLGAIAGVVIALVVAGAMTGPLAAPAAIIAATTCFLLSILGFGFKQLYNLLPQSKLPVILYTSAAILVTAAVLTGVLVFGKGALALGATVGAPVIVASLFIVAAALLAIFLVYHANKLANQGEIVPEPMPNLLESIIPKGRGERLHAQLMQDGAAPAMAAPGPTDERAEATSIFGQWQQLNKAQPAYTQKKLEHEIATELRGIETQAAREKARGSAYNVQPPPRARA